MYATQGTLCNIKEDVKKMTEKITQRNPRVGKRLLARSYLLRNDTDLVRIVISTGLTCLYRWRQE